MIEINDLFYKFGIILSNANIFNFSLELADRAFNARYVTKSPSLKDLGRKIVKEESQECSISSSSKTLMLLQHYATSSQNKKGLGAKSFDADQSEKAKPQ